MRGVYILYGSGEFWAPIWCVFFVVRVFSALGSVCCAIAYWMAAIEGLCSLLLIVYRGCEQSRVLFFVSLDSPGDTDSCWNIVMQLVSI